jgi:hypothetical protein
MTTYTTVQPGADVIFRDLGGEAVLLDLASGRYFGLNPVGTRIWMLLAEGATIDAVVATLSHEFDGDAAAIARDVDELVTELAARGLVVARLASSPPAP